MEKELIIPDINRHHRAYCFYLNQLKELKKKGTVIIDNIIIGDEIEKVDKIVKDLKILKERKCEQ